MAKTYARSTATVPVGTATSVAAILAAEGYTGSMIGKYLYIDSAALIDLYRGADGTVTDLTGILLVGGTPYIRRGKQGLPVDPGSIWLYSATGGDIALSYESF